MNGVLIENVVQMSLDFQGMLSLALPLWWLKVQLLNKKDQGLRPYKRVDKLVKVRHSN